MDKSGWGKAIKNDGIINYVDKNGTTSVEVEEHGMIYLKEESDSTSAWYAIDNSEGIFEIGSRFWVRWLSKENDPDEWWYYYKNLDDEYKNSVDSGRLWIFLTGVTAPNGEEYTNFNANLPYYIELGEDWDEEDINAVFIGRGSDEIVDITYIYDMKYPAGKKEFAKLVLKHFSPYAIYDNLTYEERKEALENADVIETADHQMYFVKTGGNISMILKGAVILGAASILAIISLKKKRED